MSLQLRPSAKRMPFFLTSFPQCDSEERAKDLEKLRVPPCPHRLPSTHIYIHRFVDIYDTSMSMSM